MSEYTREEILKMIEENGGPRGLDLSGKDLSGIDLSKEAIARELEKYQEEHPGKTPVWFSEGTGGINLMQASLKSTELSGANLRQCNLAFADLREANCAKANLERACLSIANLREARLWSANLQESTVNDADLRGTNLADADLQRAWLDGSNLQDANLHGANLQEANLQRTHLENINLAEAQSLASVYLYNAFLRRTIIKAHQLGRKIGEETDEEYLEAKEAYLSLKSNFNSLGRYDDASWAYIKERQMEKMTYHPKLAHKYYAKIDGLPQGASPKSWTWWCFYVKYTLKWLWDWIIELSCGYGERPGNVVTGALAVLIVVFPFLYVLAGLAPRSGQNLLPQDYFLL